MSKVSGITIEKDADGISRYLRVDLHKHGKALKPFLKKVGMENEVDNYDPEFVAKIKRAEKDESKKIDLGKYGISL
ncbi:MAG TPA: hypothetical protein DDW85_04995 [Porphyromonadaceae bacterium]|nr:hypothetical protein [Porphyromonadaceae bacterium]